jgi:hypothetical protein
MRRELRVHGCIRDIDEVFGICQSLAVRESEFVCWVLYIRAVAAFLFRSTMPEGWRLETVVIEVVTLRGVLSFWFRGIYLPARRPRSIPAKCGPSSRCLHSQHLLNPNELIPLKFPFHHVTNYTIRAQFFFGITIKGISLITFHTICGSELILFGEIAGGDAWTRLGENFVEVFGCDVGGEQAVSWYI